MFFKVLTVFACTVAANLTFTTAASADDFCDSKILSGESSFRQQLVKWLPGSGVWDICWRASRDGWSASRFHKGCDDIGPTVTIVQVGRNIFGGYTDASWSGYYYQVAPNTFMFSPRNKANLPPFRSELLNKSGFATRQYPTYGPTFGRGDDLYINANR